MGNTSTMPLQNIDSKSSKYNQLMAIGSNNPSPSPRNDEKQLLITSKESSIANESTVNALPAAEQAAKGPRFSTNRGRSQKVMLPLTQNIINLGTVPIVTFGVANND